MGRDVEPFTILDLVGIVLVCIGFLAYSGYGFAKSFMVAQGPPGQVSFSNNAARLLSSNGDNCSLIRVMLRVF